MKSVLCTTCDGDAVSIYIKTDQGKYAVLSQADEYAYTEFVVYDDLASLKSALSPTEYRNFLAGCVNNAALDPEDRRDFKYALELETKEEHSL